LGVGEYIVNSQAVEASKADPPERTVKMRRLPPIAFVFTCTALLLADPGDAKEALHSTIEGRTVAVSSGGPSFLVPADWVQWEKKFGTALHLTRAEIDATKDGGGEWDTEYAEVANAAIPFERCAFAGGGEGWGSEACAFSDLQARVYVVEEGREEVGKRISERGSRAVATILSPAREAKRNVSERPGRKEEPPAEGAEPRAEDHLPVAEEKDGWQRRAFSFDLTYGDYGATATVDFRFAAFGDRVLVFAFMYTNYREQDEAIAAVLDSVLWEGREKK
jgi:hypothetical protein